MDTSNWDVKKFFKVDKKSKEGRKLVDGNEKATAFHVKNLLIDGSCKNSCVISRIIREKPELFK